jgi:hypothetical protein
VPPSAYLLDDPSRRIDRRAKQKFRSPYESPSLGLLGSGIDEHQPPLQSGNRSSYNLAISVFLHQELFVNYRLIIAALAASIMLGGCSRGNIPSNPLSSTNQAVNRTRAEDAAKRVATTVYVGNIASEANSYVTVFNGGASKVLRTIPSSGRVIGLTVDVAGHLFVATEPDPGSGGLNIYGSRGAKLIQTLTQKHGFAGPVLDAEDNLYSWCATYEVCEYAADAKKVVSSTVVWRLRLSKYLLNGPIVIDLSGDVAIGNTHETLVFKPGAEQPYWKIESGYQGGIAFDASGDLYISSGNDCSTIGSVSVYEPDQTTPSRVLDLTTTGTIPTLHFDAMGNLYALAEACRGDAPSVAVFAPDTSSPLRTITKGLQNVSDTVGMVVSATGEVYVVGDADSLGSGSLVVYPPGGMHPLRTVTTGAEYPEVIAAVPGLTQ